MSSRSSFFSWFQSVEIVLWVIDSLPHKHRITLLGTILFPNNVAFSFTDPQTFPEDWSVIVTIYYLACSVIPEYSYQSFHYLTRVSASHIIFPRMFRMTDGHFMHFISTRDRNSYSVMSFQSLTRTQHGRSMLTISALKQCSNTLPAALDNIVIHPTFSSI